MHFRQLSARRKRVGLLTTLLICLVLALVLDGMIAGGRKDPNLFDLLPGQSLNLTDPMPRGTERLDQLDLRSSSPQVGLRMIETFTGFWLGGTLWRAEATIPLDAAPGEYSVVMHYQSNGTEAAPRQSYRLRIHPDAKAVQASALSLCVRALGVSPYLLAVCLLPLIALPMLASYRLSRSISLALRQDGMAEIFRAMASPEGQRIYFTPAPGKAPAENAAITVLDEDGQASLGTALVFAVKKGDVEAIMQNDAKVRPGNLAKYA